MKLALTLLALSLTTASAQSSAPLTPRIADLLTRASNGHSPTNEDIATIAVLTPAPDPADAATAVPLLLKALTLSDTSVRTFALTTLAALATPPEVPQENVPTPAPQNQPTAFKPDLARLLAPAIPQLASHLTEESQPNRTLTAKVLGAFTPDPPPAIYPPLYAFLTRDDAPNAGVGLLVVGDILQLGPISPASAEAVARYLRRPDQTPDSRANLADLIATRPYQSQSLNKSLLGYLSSDDANLRARIILTLPQLDLAPAVFADTKALVTLFAENPNESLPVINAAKAVAPCWTSTRMATGCPTY